MRPSLTTLMLSLLLVSGLALDGCSVEEQTPDDGGPGQPSDTAAGDQTTSADRTRPDAPASKGTGGTGGKPGHTMQSMTHDGQKHIFAVHVPRSYNESKPVPLLLHFHGWRPLPAGVSEELDYLWAPSTEAEGFIAVAPEGLPCPELNESDPYGCFRETRDGPFVKALVEHLGKLYDLDLDRLFLSGHSGGAYFVQGHALSHSSTYVAAVTFSGGCISSSDKYGNSCSVYKQLSAQAERKIPFFIAHHPSDQVVPVGYSADLIKVLKAHKHPIKTKSDYDAGKYGHSIDAKIVPDIWTWLASF